VYKTKTVEVRIMFTSYDFFIYSLPADLQTRFVSLYTSAVGGGELLSGDSPDRPFQVSLF
jgi:hypothetical protein